MSKTDIRRPTGLTFTLLTVMACAILSALAWQLRPSGDAQEEPSVSDRQPLAISVPSEQLTDTEATASTAASSDVEEPDATPDAEDPLLLLINRVHPLPEAYSVETTVLADYPQSVASVMYDDLCAMLAAGRSEGLSFQICSGYRTTAVQEALFSEDLNALMAQGLSYEEAYEQTAQFTMPPGCSEHESGLAVDIVSMHYQLLDESQEQTPESQWLHAHCWEYGFILRYPNGRSDITGISYEPWHYRYVGRDAAAWLTEHALTLEEFHASQRDKS